MEGLLKFNLPEDQIEFQTAVDGVKWKSVVWDFDQKLRSIIKHSNLNYTTIEQIEKLRTELHELINDNNLILD